MAQENKLRKERIKNHWIMMAWLTNFIEKNKFNWKRRQETQKKENLRTKKNMATLEQNREISRKLRTTERKEGKKCSVAG